MPDTPQVPLAVNHIGLTVPDVHAAIDWYEAVFGFRCIMGPRVLEPGGHGEAAAVFGPRFRRAWQAHLLTGNSVGIELFQFIDPPVHGPREERVPYLDRGQWHLCLTHPDVRHMVDRVVEAGGTLIAPPYEFVPGRPWTLAYTTDPWGTVLEIMSHSYAEVFGNWPQPGQLTPPTLVPRPGTADGSE
ncbi:putative enzyme related to lactoylglutathione lyase [Thermocatellispora tengchongensis]|uniref:Putative enzyme related to lactoylglutathione lyase n=1 Tax=Thermocatellispora tengchongensis TaxID=1073253 RepID=A0A840PE34_9ACTN|nr:VOC family protein [Thermocatellispora tengchongensis]MBB5137249.1 putative enzyme related to lactoylglutathione lyase [Thermocatellispora tengchongensis]